MAKREPRKGSIKLEPICADEEPIPQPETPKVRLMLDSGAFSAWSKGAVIDLGEYISYVKKNQHLLDSYFNLDVIPGRKGQKRNTQMIEDAAAASHKNLVTMKRAGLRPIPVFHQEENIKWLRMMIDENESYIALSTFKELSIPENRDWLDMCFTMLTDKDGYPRCKTHGLGIAAFDLLKRYPWHTCDATSWALTAAYGAVFVPVYRAGVPDYSITPVKLAVSEVEREGKDLPNNHYLRYGPLMKERVIHFLEKEVGVSVAAAAADYEVRAQAIVHFMLKFQAAIGEKPFRNRVRQL